MPRRTSAGKPIPVRVVILTLDSHLAGAISCASNELRKDIPGLQVQFHAVARFNSDNDALTRCKQDIAQADIILTTMLFMEEHFKPVLASLEARKESCDALISCLSAGEAIRLTKMGGFRMSGSQGGAISLLKRLRGANKHGASSGAKQMAMLRQIPKFLRFIPGRAQDVRAYFLVLQYWLAGSTENMAQLIKFLINRYAAGPRKALKGSLKVLPPKEYPEIGVYHPRLPGNLTDNLDAAPKPQAKNSRKVGLLVMRAHVLSGDTAHYDGAIAEIEARGFQAIPVFASGLDARPAIEKFFLQDGATTIDALVSLTGFSLVGGPAYNDSKAAAQMLKRLDVPYISALPVGFQSLKQWEESAQGLLPLESTMMVGIPELDGATGSMVIGGRSSKSDGNGLSMTGHAGRAKALADRVEKLVKLRCEARAERRVAVVIFNFPPNGGSVGSAAHLSVFASLHNVLKRLKSEGYTVDLPGSAEEMKEMILGGNSERFGADANVFARIPVDDHVRREPWLADIEKQWGPAPGRQLSDGRSLFVLGKKFGNVLIGLQPSMGYEGDPMMLMFDKGLAPTHAFSAFYRYLREDFGAHALLHFGTHGALEFMPGKQVGLSDACWPERLMGSVPNFYFYAANNPSEGTIAKRRSAATLISYLTPAVTQAGLYQELRDLKESIDRWRGLGKTETTERQHLEDFIWDLALKVDLVSAAQKLDDDSEWISTLSGKLHELEESLIPHGLHVIGETPREAFRKDMLLAAAQIGEMIEIDATSVDALIAGASPDEISRRSGSQDREAFVRHLEELAALNENLAQDWELPAMVEALDGGFVSPSPGGDILSTPAVLPTGRNLHGFDPFRLPTSFAVSQGFQQAERLLARHRKNAGSLPESIAMVLWGTDNLKSGGGPIAQALALLGARPRFDSFGRLAGAALIPLEELRRPRIDVIATLSGIFRDLLPLQTKMLAEAAYLAASAEEPEEMNFVRKHVLSYQAQHDCDFETAALRVFSNADGSYGSNVNHLIESGDWSEGDELAETFGSRKCFAYGRAGAPVAQRKLMDSLLSDVELAYQNLDSLELGITTVDHYFDTLGAISYAASRIRGKSVEVYIGDQTQGAGTVRTLNEQIDLEVRTRSLNPKWYESMLEHGYEGVRQIEVHLTNTMGWSATTAKVDPWVYQKMTETYVLDETMRNRLAELNPKASARVANRLLEAHERQFWSPDESVLEALRDANDQLEDQLEGVGEIAAA